MFQASDLKCTVVSFYAGAQWVIGSVLFYVNGKSFLLHAVPMSTFYNCEMIQICVKGEGFVYGQAK